MIGEVAVHVYNTCLLRRSLHAVSAGYLRMEETKGPERCGLLSKVAKVVQTMILKSMFITLPYFSLILLFNISLVSSTMLLF